MSYAHILAEKLNQKFQHRTNFTSIDVKHGKKYDKLIHDGSVFAFVSKETGEVIKPATYASPARNAQGQTAGKYFVADKPGLDITVHNADIYGGFLYSDYRVVTL